MIKGERARGETAYRKIDALNQSALCLYAKDPMKFYREFILGEKGEDEDTFATLVGSLSDFFLLTCNGNEELFNQRFDEEFALYSDTKGSGQVFVLADNLFDIAKRTVVDGVVTGNFTTMFQEAFLNTQAIKRGEGYLYGGKDWKKGLVDFNANGKTYYDTLINNVGKKVVDMKVVGVSKRVSNQLLADENVRWVFKGNDDVEELNKFPIEFHWGEFECKMEADKIQIHHDEGVIQPWDLKCVYDNEAFEVSYLKRMYYIQAAWYKKGIEEWAKGEGLSKYIVNPMKFIVCDTSVNNRRPLIYETNIEMFREAMSGFTYKGERYKGIIQLLDDIEWAQNNGIWNISPENYKNNSIIQLKPFNESSNS